MFLPNISNSLSHSPDCLAPRNDKQFLLCSSGHKPGTSIIYKGTYRSGTSCQAAIMPYLCTGYGRRKADGADGHPTFLRKGSDYGHTAQAGILSKQAASQPLVLIFVANN